MTVFVALEFLPDDLSKGVPALEHLRSRSCLRIKPSKIFATLTKSVATMEDADFLPSF
jgi:hypothetical protein